MKTTLPLLMMSVVVGMILALTYLNLHARQSPYQTPQLYQEDQWVKIDARDPNMIQVNWPNFTTSYVGTKGLQVTVRLRNGRTVTFEWAHIEKALENVK